MTDTSEHIASCVCGSLRVTAKGDPDVVVACNCTECQRRTGSPFGVGAYYPKASIVSIEGEANSFTRTAETGRSLSNKFCPNCGTAVYWTLDMRPDHFGIAVGCFTDPSFVAPTRTIWTKNQHHWMLFPDEMPSFPEASP